MMLLRYFLIQYNLPVKTSTSVSVKLIRFICHKLQGYERHSAQH